MAQPTTSLPQLKPQEIPLDHPESRCLFVPSPGKPFVATPPAIAFYGIDTILACLHILQQKARLHRGLDYLQVFKDPNKKQPLWFIDDGGAITALLPSDY